MSQSRPEAAANSGPSPSSPDHPTSSTSSRTSSYAAPGCDVAALDSRDYFAEAASAALELQRYFAPSEEQMELRDVSRSANAWTFEFTIIAQFGGWATSNYRVQGVLDHHDVFLQSRDVWMWRIMFSKTSNHAAQELDSHVNARFHQQLETSSNPHKPISAAVLAFLSTTAIEPASIVRAYQYSPTAFRIETEPGEAMSVSVLDEREMMVALALGSTNRGGPLRLPTTSATVAHVLAGYRVTLSNLLRDRR